MADAEERMRQEQFEKYLCEDLHQFPDAVERLRRPHRRGYDYPFDNLYSAFCAGHSAAGERVRELERKMKSAIKELRHWATKVREVIPPLEVHLEAIQVMLEVEADNLELSLAPPVDAPGKDEHE